MTFLVIKTRKLGFAFRLIHMGFMVNKEKLGWISSEHNRFSSVHFHPTGAPCSSLICVWYNRTSEAEGNTGLCLTQLLK
jgi:hypothetical protein